MVKVNTQKKKWKTWGSGFFIGLFSNIIIYAIINGYDFVFTLKPLTIDISNRVNKLGEIVNSTNERLARMEDFYLFKDSNGQDCIVGVNPQIEIGCASAYKDNNLKLENGERISLIRNDGIHAPSVVTVTIVIIEKPDNAPDSRADFFINKVAVERLGYN